MKMVLGLAAKDYPGRLKELGLQSLEERPHQADMCMVQKIMHRKGGLNTETWFERADNHRHTRSADDPFGIKKVFGKAEMRKNFFSEHVIDSWNQIPAELKS